jgi:hypothetical protein
MKKLFFLILSLGILGSCNNKKAADKTDDVKTTDTVKKEPVDEKVENKEAPPTETVTGWPEKDKNDFLNSCIESSLPNTNDRTVSQTYCSCMLDKLQQEYPDIERVKTLTDDDINTVLEKYKDGCLPR